MTFHTLESHSAHQEENHFKGAEDLLLSGTSDESITTDKHRIYVYSFWQLKKRENVVFPKLPEDTKVLMPLN